MTTGCLIFAYDSEVAYGPQAVLAAKLVAKHLSIPVSLVTDSATVERLADVSMFHNVFTNEVGEVTNTRVLAGTTVVWKNTNRSSAYDITPYDRTLIIDSDFLVFSNRLKHYLEADADFMICPGMYNLHPNREDNILLDPASIPMLWATNIIFNKTDEVRSIFELVEHIKEHWIYYSALYKFDFARFRNDYAFSIACHILSGHGVEKFHIDLPSPILFTDKDKLVKISKQGLTALLDDNMLVKSQGQDVHLMNKFDILEHYDQLTELVND